MSWVAPNGDEEAGTRLRDAVDHRREDERVIRRGEALIGDRRFPMEGDAPDGPAVAYVRPHDILIWPVGRVPSSGDATAPRS